MPKIYAGGWFGIRVDGRTEQPTEIKRKEGNEMEKDDKDYEEYLEKYAKDRGISKEEAETHEIVKSYKEREK